MGELPVRWRWEIQTGLITKQLDSKQEEKDLLQKLNSWRPVEKWKVRKFHLKRVQTEEMTLMYLIPFYPGLETDTLTVRRVL